MTVKKITPEELFQKMENQENILLLDVRAEEKYNNFHIKSSSINNLNIYKSDIFELEENKEEIIHSLPNDKEIIITCTTGNSATKCANILSEREYNVAVLEGGITAWKEYINTK